MCARVAEIPTLLTMLRLATELCLSKAVAIPPGAQQAERAGSLSTSPYHRPSMPTEEAAAPVGSCCHRTSLRQQAMVSFRGQEHAGSGREAATRQETQQGRRRLACAAQVDGRVVSVATLELAPFCGFSVPQTGPCPAAEACFTSDSKPARRFGHLSRAESSCPQSQRQF